MSLYSIRVTNVVTNVVFEHKQVPMDHIEMLRVNPNLDVEVLEIETRGRRGKRKDDQKNS